MQKIVMAFTEEQVSTTLNDDCEAALELLLAFDTSKVVKATCVSIGVRTVKEKVWQWVEQQVDEQCVLQNLEHVQCS